MSETGSSTATQPMITSEGFDALAPEWAALHASIPSASPFSHPAWFETWLRHFGARTSPVFLSVRLSDELAAVVPLDAGRDSARLLGDHNVCDYAGILARPGDEAAIAAGVVEWLMEDLTPALELWGIEEDSPLRTAFADGAGRFGWSFEEAHEAVSPAAALPGDFETYVAGLGKHDRHELRRKLRNLAAAGTVTFERATAPADVMARFDRFLEMMRISRGDKDEFLTPQMESYFRDLAQTFAGLGMAGLSTLSVDGKDAAMLFSFENSSTTFLYNSGYDPAYMSLAVGLLSKAYAIDDAIRRGKQTFDFLRGDEEYKRHLGGVSRDVFSFYLRQQA